MPFTMSRYTLPSLVAREAPRRGKNKHNLNVSRSPRPVSRIRELRITGPLDSDDVPSLSHAFALSFSLFLAPRLTEATALQYYNITHKHVARSQQFRDAIIMQRARARARARRMTPSEPSCSIHTGITLL